MTHSTINDLTVSLGDRSYPIRVCHDRFEGLGELVRERCGGRRALIITDAQVGPLYAQTVGSVLERAGYAIWHAEVPMGEASKSLRYVEQLYERCFEAQAERKDCVIALGGGVVGDLAGFVAATFKRGLPYVQVPTSLLAMVDSSVGGKTGINLPHGKNMVGSFHQPRLVYANTATLKTLPPRELSCGLAETVKHAVIRNSAFFDWLEQRADAILNLEPECLMELVRRNCAIKAAVVSEDETEAGLRGILNFGHTIGHALEILRSKDGMLHGEAVSLGMVAAWDIAVKRGMVSADIPEAAVTLQQRFGLPVQYEPAVAFADIYEAMKHDKKVEAGRIRFVLPTQIGDCTFADDVSEEEIRAAAETLWT